jgi:hypothetical protein
MKLNPKVKLPKAAGSKLERDFALYWRASDGIQLETEVAFHPVRKWRFDFANTPAKVAIELEGGVFSGGRHTRGAGYAEDCDKYNEAALLGWTVFRLTRKQLSIPLVERLADFVRTRTLLLAPDPYRVP